MGSESEYLANARECEGRAQEMLPALRQTFVSLAEQWRKKASDAAEAADRRQIQEAAKIRKADKG
jgi:predicted transcriptional regulator